MDGLRPNQFQGVHMNDTLVVEDLVSLNILLCDIDIVHGNIIAELARRILQKYETTEIEQPYIVYEKHWWSLAIFLPFRSPNCDISFNRTSNLERHLTTCSEPVKNVYLRNVYQIRETVFDKLDSFGIK